MSTLIDGVAGTRVDVTDRGLQYGDGLFETISCRDGRARWLTRHFARLRAGCERLRIGFAQYAALEQEILALSAGVPACLIKVIVTRGRAARRGYAPAGDEQATRIVSRHDWPCPEPQAPLFRIARAGVTLGCNPALAGLKHLNRLEQVLAQMECRARGLDEVLMLSAAGAVIGGSMSNLFVVDAAGLATPAVEQCGVAGVMRGCVLDAAARLGMPVRVRTIDAAELGRVQEAFVTNVRWELQSVGELDGRTLSSGDCARRLRGAIDAA